MPTGIFVTARNHLEGRSGGVQVCTREYIGVIEAAGIDLRFYLSEGDRRLSTRILRRAISSRYFRPAEPALVAAVARLAVESKADFLFLNQMSLASLAAQLRPFLPVSCRIVALSHGLESTDLLHLIRLRDRLPLTGRLRPTAASALGETILAESSMARHLDFVFVLSPSDAELQRWAGAPRVGWLPRIVEPDPVDWRPLGTRVGFVGTLDHAPNLEGLVAVLDQLTGRGGTGSNIGIRVVGGPGSTGAWLAGKYAAVDYLGPLSDDQLRAEAQTWNAFIHPIFCQPRGCSTKLATAIAWAIPVITTTAGHRGYEWGEGGFVIAEDPNLFAAKCIELCDHKVATRARSEVEKLARTSPSQRQVAAKIREFLRI